MGHGPAIIRSGAMAGHLAHAGLASMSIGAFRGNTEGQRGDWLEGSQQKEERGDETHGSSYPVCCLEHRGAGCLDSVRFCLSVTSGRSLIGFLDTVPRGARVGPVGAEHATVPDLWLHHRVASGALPKVDAGVGRHRLHRRRGARRAPDRRLGHAGKSNNRRSPYGTKSQPDTTGCREPVFNTRP